MLLLIATEDLRPRRRAEGEPAARHRLAQLLAIGRDELVVERDARKDNSSNYWLNGKKSNHKEVTALLRTRGTPSSDSSSTR